MSDGDSTPSDSPAVMAVIIHWGSVDDTCNCVASLLEQDYRRLSVAVLDNGTGTDWDGCLGELRSRVEVLALSENSGFTGGVNQAAAFIRDRSIRWGWILNNDTVFPRKDTLQTLVKFAAARDACLFTPQLLNRSGSRLLPCSGGIFFPSLAYTFHNTGWFVAVLKRMFRHHTFLSGTAWFVDCEQAPDPLLDEAYFAYFEDVDLALRLGADRMAICEEASIVHEVSASTGGSLFKYYLKVRNLFYLARKHGLCNWRFRLGFLCVFVPSEARKYLGQLPGILHETRRAIKDSTAMSTSAPRGRT